MRKTFVTALCTVVLGGFALAQNDQPDQPTPPTLEERVTRVVEGLGLDAEQAEFASAAFGAYEEANEAAKATMDKAAAGVLSEEQLTAFNESLTRRGQRGQRGQRQPRGERPEGERQPRGERPEGERQPRGERPEGDESTPRGEGERQPRGERPEGERQPRGERPDFRDPEARRTRQLERFARQIEGLELDEATSATLTDAYTAWMDARTAAREQLTVDLGSFLDEEQARQAMRLFTRGDRGQRGGRDRGQRQQPGANDFY